MNRIPAEALALKLQAIRNLEYPEIAEQLQQQPRMVELLWFLQAMSLRPGGLELFAQGLVAASEKRFQAVTRREACGVFNAAGDSVYGPKSTHSRERCMDEARRCLAQYLFDLAVIKDKRLKAPWYFSALFDALTDAIAAHKAEALNQIADTETARQAFHWLEFSSQMRTPVPIIGASRFGKSTAVRAWCDSRPGLARLVTVPQSNTERDLVLAIADAFGIEYTHNTETARIRDQVRLVLKHSGVFIVFDEAHFLVPISFSRNTPPRRLNWVRCEVIDKGVGCAFFATPQSYKQTLDRYAKETGYALEQWLGRMAPPVTLPEELGREDLLAVATLHFPGIPADQREMICAAAMASEGYLKNIELFAKYAQFLAGQRTGQGCAAKVAPEDVDAAIRHFIPAASRKPAAQPLQRVCEPVAEVPAARRTGFDFDRSSVALAAAERG